ncbi:MAG: DNA repair protein RecO [Alphaproteobacteria bacterium]|nr:DNA repair protein RecO [Alphaproteobacteria bacterium]
MKLESVGILIGLRPFGERDAVATIFTRDHGVLTGMMRGAIIAKKNKPLTGQMGLVSWNARLDSQLGVFHWESERNLAVPLMMDSATLGLMNSAFALITMLLPEREKYEALFIQTKDLLENLPNKDARKCYLTWEINLLRELGYALDLTRCSNCGCTDNLTHISPRTARAVCSECAEPYLDKLFELPADLNTTKKFLEKIVDEQGGKGLPQARIFIN